MPQWTCEWEGCEKPAAQRTGDCLLCGRHLCRTHRRDPWHECPKPEENWKAYSSQYAAAEARHIDELCHQIDHDKLCSRASMLRAGIPCTVNLSRESLSSKMGNQNCHAEITFNDGVKWMARFRLTWTSSPPQEVRDWVLQSEAATMIYLREHTCIPTPMVYDWACESDPANQLGVGYILMEKLDGRPLDWEAATPQQKEKVLQQLVNMFLEIERHPFNAMGSLVFSGRDRDAIDVQGLAHQSTYQVGKGSLGPFSSLLQGSQAVIRTYLAMIGSGEIDPCCPIDTYLVHRFRLDIVGRLSEDISAGNHFYLKHPDDKGDHILVNDCFDIVGVIDWEWAQTVSRAEAFCSPCMLWPVAKFYEGSNELTEEEMRLAAIFREKGREDLANCVINGRKVQRFFFALGPESSFLDIQGLRCLFTGLRRAFNLEECEWETWKRRSLLEWKDDSLLSGLLELEEVDK